MKIGHHGEPDPVDPEGREQSCDGGGPESPRSPLRGASHRLGGERSKEDPEELPVGGTWKESPEGWEGLGQVDRGQVSFSGR